MSDIIKLLPDSVANQIAAGEVTGPADYGVLGDVSTLLNPDLIDELVAGRQ